MRPLRLLTLLVLIVAELATLTGIVLVLRTTSGISRDWWGINFGGPMQVSEERVIPLKNLHGTLQIVNDVGKVEVRTGAGSYGVQADVHGFGWSEVQARKALQQVRIDTTDTGNGTRVEVQGPVHLAGQMPYANLVVTVPSGLSVDVDASMGSVTLDHVTGNVRVNANMGRVNAVGFKGDLAVDAKMGRVDLEQMAIANTLDVKANMGAVSFAGRLGKQNSFDANMGNIDIDLPAGHAAMQLEADWSMGSWHTSLPLNGTNSEHHAEGVLGRGTVGGRLKVDADMGRIRIN